jgi:hypothetical protein
MAVSSAQAAQDWVNGLSAKTGKMQASAQAVTVAPGQAAARQKAAYLQGVQSSVDTWARNVAAVSREDWINAYVTKGIPRVASGASAAQARMTAVFDKLLPYIERGKSTLPARGTFEQNKQRVSAWMDYMHAYKG